MISPESTKAPLRGALVRSPLLLSYSNYVTQIGSAVFVASRQVPGVLLVVSVYISNLNSANFPTAGHRMPPTCLVISWFSSSVHVAALCSPGVVKSPVRLAVRL